MKIAPPRHDEAAALSALQALEVVDTGPEAEFDALVRAASLVCGVPVSLISLVDAERQWFKANLGLPGVSETPRDVAFCAHAVLGEQLFEVPDALQDPRFADNPLVAGQPDIRFYAGAPVRLSDGSRVGTLCVIDREPRQLNDTQREVLRCLAVAAAQALEGRLAMRKRQQATDDVARAVRDLKLSEARFRALSDASPLGIYGIDAQGACTYANQRWQDIFGLTLEQSLGPGWAETLHADDRAAVFGEWQRCAVAAVEFNMQFRILRPDGALRDVHSRARSVLDANGALSGFVGSVEDITDRKRLSAELAGQHELLRVTLKSIGDAVITADARGDVLWLNPVAERLTGWLSSEAKGRP